MLHPNSHPVPVVGLYFSLLLMNLSLLMKMMWQMTKSEPIQQTVWVGKILISISNVDKWAFFRLLAKLSISKS